MNKKIEWKNSGEDLSKFKELTHQQLIGSYGGRVSAKKYKGKFLKEFSQNKENKHILSEAGKKGGRVNVESGHIRRLNEIYAKENAKYFDHEERICPNCNEIIKGLGMYSRWHGDNCKQLKKIEEQKKIISDLPNVFTSNDVVEICKKLNYNNKKIKFGLCKNTKYIELIKKGTNQSNPSIFKKLY